MFRLAGAILIAALALSVGGCNKASDNQCHEFSAYNGSFDQCTWLLSEGDALCRNLGYSNFFGTIDDTTCVYGDTTRYITKLTCCK